MRSEEFAVRTFLPHVVVLGVGHGTAIEPHVDEVGLAHHLLAAGRDQHHAVDVRTVQVELGIVVGGVRIRIHEARLDGFLDLGTKFFDAADANLFLAVLGAPNGQRRAPVARTREVPVDEVLQPVAETAATSSLGLPVDGLVEFDHAVFQGRRLDEPAVERIVEHGFVGAPAVRVVVRMFLALEELAFFLQHHHDVDVQGLVLLGLGGVVGVLHKLACIGAIGFHVHAVLDELGVEVFDAEELACAVHHRLWLAVLVDHLQGRDASGGSHALVVGTEGRGDVDDTCTVLRGDIVARDDAESTFARVDPRNQLFIFNANEVLAFVFLDDLRSLFEHRFHQGFGHQNTARLFRIGMDRLQKDIINIRSHTECRI